MELDIKIAGIVLSRVGRQSTFRDQTTADLRKQFPGNMFNSEIKERSVVTESTAKNKSVYEMGDPAAKKEFSDFSEELLKKVGLKK
jgi:cellulose biosynthesis protein BcsQ